MFNNHTTSLTHETVCKMLKVDFFENDTIYHLSGNPEMDVKVIYIGRHCLSQSNLYQLLKV